MFKVPGVTVSRPPPGETVTVPAVSCMETRFLKNPPVSRDAFETLAY